MSLELRDFRGKLTPETVCALESEKRATGQDHQDIVREILHGWALKRLHAASVLRGLMQAEGLAAEGEGTHARPNT